MLKERKKDKKVFVGMSGGVDSSVAAFLLKKQGYSVIGIFMKCFNVDGCAERDAEDARRVAEKLKIPFYVWDFEEEYKKKVVKYMVEGYKKGITPNPDVMCNKEIKFGLFLEKALKMGADYVATGHYVNLKSQISNFKSNKYKLFQAKDKNKDQSYFLWTLTQKQLKHCLFPIGDYLKSEVRQIARKAGLITAEKKDSQGICFLGKITLSDFMKQYIPEKNGSVLDISGKKIGNHKGAHFYTIGQRHGLGIGGSKKPYYIVEKNVKKNIVVVAEGDDNPALYKKEIKLTDVNLMNYELGIRNYELRKKSGEIKISVLARVRYRQPLAQALFIIHNSLFKLVFAEPVKFIAPGQSAVFYLPAEASAKEGNKKGEMLGGGVIV